MTEPSTNEIAVETPEESPDGESSATGLAGLARTMRRRTADVVAIGILAIAALTFGKEIIGWWQAGSEPPPPVENVTGGAELGWNDPGVPVRVAFGNAGLVLHRERISGDVDRAVERLLERAVEMLERTETKASSNVRDGERRMLEAIEDLEPVRAREGAWSVYVVATPQPTVVGVREAGDCATCTPRRVACWGVLMGDVKPDSWTAFWFDPAGGSATPGGTRPIPLPPGSVRTLALTDDRGDGVVGFEQTADPREWMRHFGQSLSEREGWRTSGWRAAGNVRAARFDRAETGRFVEVRFAIRGGRLEGLLTVGSPAVHDDASNERTTNDQDEERR